MLPALLLQADATERAQFAATAMKVTLPVGQQILIQRETPMGMAFPVAGTVRVYLISSEGREMTLYRIEPGSACVLTASCILGGVKFPAMDEVEKELFAWTVPAAVFHQWVNRSEFWRRFVFQLLGQRLASVLARLEETSFDRVDCRLARLLLLNGSDEWIGSHERLAVDVGSAREVVSRTLMRWRTAGWIETWRGGIKVLDRAALQTLRASAGN